MVFMEKVRHLFCRSARGVQTFCGQASVEFIVVLPLFLLVVFSIFAASFSFFERSFATQRLTSLGSELPSNWETLSNEELVKNLLCDDGILDPSNVRVTSASVTVPPATREDVDPDSVAQAFGKTRSTVEMRTLEVQADVSYTYRDLLSLGASTSMSGHVERTYLIGQKYEIT
ncbi:TadE/TadG family type IV pilus assembly protein [Eggerthella timonensis]|uniref:TadE/TadG family type IV pilus assembly protein n=1 Tax=Eggerthella timonensis TaxID=1871008 RepID=UPI000C7611EA|nr:TadE/TadG family type IV pilus assembly protein [Eggerthella timonensis]